MENGSFCRRPTKLSRPAKMRNKILTTNSATSKPTRKPFNPQRKSRKSYVDIMSSFMWCGPNCIQHFSVLQREHERLGKNLSHFEFENERLSSDIEKINEVRLSFNSYLAKFNQYARKWIPSKRIMLASNTSATLSCQTSKL